MAVIWENSVKLYINFLLCQWQMALLWSANKHKHTNTQTQTHTVKMKWGSVGALLVLVVTGCALGANAYVRDTPYRELVSHRYLFKSQDPIANFNQLSFDAVHAITGCTVHDSAGWLLATELGLTWFTRGNVNKAIPVGDSIDWVTSHIICKGENKVFIIDQNHVFNIAIDDTEVQASHRRVVEGQG